MAYIDQAKKAVLAPRMKQICAKYGIKASVALRHHSTLVLNISQGKLDFMSNFAARTGKECKGSLNVNPYWYQEHFTGDCLAFLTEVLAVMNNGNHDRSDIQTDYFDVGWYVDINIGAWNKPYNKV